MASITITLDDSDLDVLQATKSLAIYDVQTQEMQGEFDVPNDLIKASTPSLTSQLKKEAQKEGLAPDSYEIEWYLILGKTEEDVNTLVFIEEEEDAILTAATELGGAEVNGFKDFKLFLSGVVK